MAKLSLNSIPNSVFKVNANDVADKNATRASIVSAGRLLAAEYAKKGVAKLRSAANRADSVDEPILNSNQYKELNERFQADHMLYAAHRVCDFTGEEAPSNFDEFKRNSLRFYGNKQFYTVLQGIYQEIITPILPAVYSEAVDVFADVVSVGFGETYSVTIESNDIPIFQDTAWGAQRSIPRNRFYSKDITLNPIPRAAMVTAKWTQLVSNGYDFGRFFANITAGMYAKTMGLWNATMTAAASDTSLVPSGLTYAFSSINWVTLANKIAALCNTSISNLVAVGGAVPLAKVLPTQATGSSNVNMDAALATLLGPEHNRSGFLGEFMGVRLLPLMDAVVPGTQNGNVTTILDANKIWMMASNGRKPLTIAYNSETPITFEMDPTKTGDFEIGINMTMALEAAAVFSNRVGLVTIS